MGYLVDFKPFFLYHLVIKYTNTFIWLYIDEPSPLFHMENSCSGARVDDEGAGETIVKEFDWGETPPSVAVVRLIAVAMNCDPVAVAPLAETVDPDALDRLVLSMDGGAELRFRHHRLSVLLCADGTTSVTPETA